MTRKISKEAAQAFINRKPFNKQNMCVSTGERATHMYLHGNLIAKRNHDNLSLDITLANWPTNTTRERINTLFNELNLSGFGVFQRGGKQYFTNPLTHYEIQPKEIVHLTF